LSDNDNAAALISKMRARGYLLAPKGGGFTVRPIPGQAITTEQADQLRMHKPAVLAVLRREAFRAAMLGAVDDIAGQWVADTEPGLVLLAAEAELDAAALAVEQDLDTALAVLVRWRQLWLDRCRAERSYQGKAGQAHSRGRIGRRDG